MITYEKACELLGHDLPPDWPTPESRQTLTEAVDEASKGGTAPMRPQDAALMRDQFDMFG